MSSITRRQFASGIGTLTAAFMLPRGAAGNPAHSADDLEAEFSARGVTGTFAHLDLQTDRVTLVGAARAQKRFIPASTFKIPNTLIAIETGAVSGPDEVFAWDGKPRAFKTWDKDMTLAEALRVSNVPVYQEIARRVGLKSYEDWLDTLGYGNATPGTAVDRFWLDGPLTISAIEQTSFLAALCLEELPLRRASQQAVKAMLRQDERKGRTLYAKTGWCTSTSPNIGWWVGWVEGEGRKDTFALNIDVASEADLPKRIEIGKVILARMGLFGG